MPVNETGAPLVFPTLDPPREVPPGGSWDIADDGTVSFPEDKPARRPKES